MRLKKSSLKMLSNLLDNIHDNYFWINQVVYNKDKSEVVLQLGEKKKGPFNKVLRFSMVAEYVCEDIAGTGLNSINVITVDTVNNVIIVECNAPADIRLSMQPDFEIILEE